MTTVLQVLPLAQDIREDHQVDLLLGPRQLGPVVGLRRETHETPCPRGRLHVSIHSSEAQPRRRRTLRRRRTARHPPPPAQGAHGLPELAAVQQLALVQQVRKGLEERQRSPDAAPGGGQRERLAVKIFGPTEPLELKVEEVTLVKKAVATAFSRLIVLRVWPILDPAEGTE
jgi:hypothetical protein